MTTLDDIRAALIPKCKWHYLFHFLVMAVASSYWIGSLIKLPPEVSWAEIAMYRPRGDNQVYPVISALSQFNLGDPTDALHQGKGTAGAQAVVLFPFAVAYALFGAPGYMVADVVLTWVYFIGLLMLLRRCNFSDFSSLVVGSAIATRSLQILCAKFGESFAALLSVSELMGTWEWGFPNLLDLAIFVQRIPRPMGTEIFLVMLFYFLLRQWHEGTVPTLRRGFAIGALLVLLLQGDPFSLSAIGLVMLFVVGWTVVHNKWQWPWRFIGGLAAGSLLFGSYFLWQRFFEHPDATVRFGLANFPRNRVLFLPGYGPLLRVGVVCLLAFLVSLAARRISTNAPKAEPAQKQRKTKSATPPEATVPLEPRRCLERSIASFFVLVIIAGWLAQPIQLLLLGKGSQTYHYLLFMLPMLYSYAVVVLLFNLFKLSTAPEMPALVRRLGERPHWTGAILLAFVIGMQALVGMENKVVTVSTLVNSRQETHVPWAHVGIAYRPRFRELEYVFRNNPELREAKTFATLNYEVNFLLAGFHGKRAYLPDNAYSTLSDEELEGRLCEVLKILQLPPQEFPGFVQISFMLNYWLGCAKYWMTSEYQYSTPDDYSPEQRSDLAKQAKQSPWILCLPKSESARLTKKYEQVLQQEPPRDTYPDTIIVGIEKTFGMFPNPQWYREVYTNDVFSVYLKKPVAVSKL